MNRLRLYRLSKGLSQMELSQITGINITSISEHELGKATPTPEIMKKYYFATRRAVRGTDFIEDLQREWDKEYYEELK